MVCSGYGYIHLDDVHISSHDRGNRIDLFRSGLGNFCARIALLSNGDARTTGKLLAVPVFHDRRFSYNPHLLPKICLKIHSNIPLKILFAPWIGSLHLTSQTSTDITPSRYHVEQCRYWICGAVLFCAFYKLISF